MAVSGLSAYGKSRPIADIRLGYRRAVTGVKERPDPFSYEGPVPRYYFDCRENEQSVCDDDGIELANLDAAKEVAARALTEIARDILVDGSGRSLGMQVREDNGQVMLTTELTFKPLGGQQIG